MLNLSYKIGGKKDQYKEDNGFFWFSKNMKEI